MANPRVGGRLVNCRLPFSRENFRGLACQNNRFLGGNHDVSHTVGSVSARRIEWASSLRTSLACIDKMSCCRCVGSSRSRCPVMHSVCLLPRARAVLTSDHQQRASARACQPAGVGLAERAWACVGPYLGLQRASDVTTCLYSYEGLGCAKHQPLSQLTSDLRVPCTNRYRAALAT